MLRDVDWNRSYPMRMESERFIAVRKNWGFRLIYDVYIKQSETILLGTCIVKLSQKKKSQRTFYKVSILGRENALFRKRLEEIGKFIIQNIDVK